MLVIVLQKLWSFHKWVHTGPSSSHTASYHGKPCNTLKMTQLLILLDTFFTLHSFNFSSEEIVFFCSLLSDTLNASLTGSSSLLWSLCAVRAMLCWGQKKGSFFFSNPHTQRHTCTYSIHQEHSALPNQRATIITGLWQNIQFAQFFTKTGKHFSWVWLWHWTV